MNLRQVQRLFWRAMTWPTGVDDFLAQADDATRAQFEQVFGETDGFGRAERVGVYAESYYWRLEEVLGDQFRVTAWVAGDAEFHNLCTDFVLRVPSRRADVRRFAAGFRDFVTGHPLAARIVGIEDVARVEWGAVEAIDAADTPLWNESDLAAIPLPQWPELTLRPAPGVSLHTCRLPYAKMWADRAAERPSPPPPPPLDPPQSVLVWRKGLEVFHRTVVAAEARALGRLLAGTRFGPLVEGAAHDTGSEPAEVVGWLRRWVRDTMLATP